MPTSLHVGCPADDHATDVLCSRIAHAIAAAAAARDARAFVACDVLLARRTVLIGGEMGFWPPMGHYEGVLAQIPALVRDELYCAREQGLPLAAAPEHFEVLLRVDRLSGARARQLAGSGDRDITTVAGDTGRPADPAMAGGMPAALVGTGRVRLQPPSPDVLQAQWRSLRLETRQPRRAARQRRAESV